MAVCVGHSLHAPASAEAMDVPKPGTTAGFLTSDKMPGTATIVRQSAQKSQERVFASTVKPGCKPTSHLGPVAMVVGAQSRCLGGSLTRAEREMAAFENRTADNDPAASLALRQDPRRITKVPLTASAGFAVPLSAHAQIGVEYSFSQQAETSPFHFRNGGGFADETAGHSARFHVGLKL